MVPVAARGVKRRAGCGGYSGLSRWVRRPLRSTQASPDEKKTSLWTRKFLHYKNRVNAVHRYRDLIRNNLD